MHSYSLQVGDEFFLLLRVLLASIDGLFKNDQSRKVYVKGMWSVYLWLKFVVNLKLLFKVIYGNWL